jgi:RNA polymerase sigma factor (TIGR02999 family)
MTSHPSEEITELLLAWSDGDRNALDRLVPLVHAELHRIAHRYMGREVPGHTLQSTALVNEVYLRLVDQRRTRWRNRTQFFGISAQLMRRILVDLARARQSAKRGGPVRRAPLEDALLVTRERGADLVALDEALGALAAIDPRKVRVVECRFFGGLSVEETAEILEISTDTVMRDWTAAKAWLYHELAREPGDDT